MPDDESQAPEEDEDPEPDFGDPGGPPDGGASSGGEEDSKDEEGYEDEEDSDTEAARLAQIKAFERSLATLREKNKKQKSQTLSPPGPTIFQQEMLATRYVQVYLRL